MNIRTSITAAGAAALLAGTGAFLLPAAASAHSMTHTLKFTVVQEKSVGFSETTGAAVEEDLDRAGKTIGFDTIYYISDPKTNTASAGVTFDTNGGFLYGTLKFTNKPVTYGTVTGGTGIFKGATGTIAGKNLNKSGTRTAVTITYNG